MSAHFLQEINWQRPWLAPFRQTAALVGARDDWRDIINRLAQEKHLLNHRGLPIHFVPQSELPANTAYESHISSTGDVPTRDNLHDFFNALVWLTFPRIKIQLNALQSSALEKAGPFPKGQASIRGTVRDAATIFDENAALFVARDAELLARLREHDWRGLFVVGRTTFEKDVHVGLFGHALIEKLVRPYKSITAHAWTLVADDAFFALPLRERCHWLDETIAGHLSDGMNTRVYSPLPVLGIPGWWEGQDEAFYEDTAVFRPHRRR